MTPDGVPVVRIGELLVRTVARTVVRTRWNSGTVVRHSKRFGQRYATVGAAPGQPGMHTRTNRTQARLRTGLMRVSGSALCITRRSRTVVICQAWHASMGRFRQHSRAQYQGANDMPPGSPAHRVVAPGTRLTMVRPCDLERSDGPNRRGWE